MFNKNHKVKIGSTHVVKTSVEIRNKQFREKENLKLAKLYKEKIKHYINILKLI